MKVEWPLLPVAAWADTYATLHMWSQVVGKVRLALAPPVNHWWHVTLYVTARGLTTSPIPYRGGAFEMAFDFIDHRLTIETSEGTRKDIALVPRSVADFYQLVMTALRDLGIQVRIWPMPVEVPSPIRFDRDTQHGSYEAEAANRFWRVLLQADAVLKEFRSRFIGKCSPVHFFWGSFDLAVTRFNGRPTNAKADADPITREAYSHELTSVGFWPGTLAQGASAIDAAFYAYASPEPPGYKSARAGPAGAFYSPDLNIFILRYDDVRGAASPREALLDFLQTTYEVGADLGKWDRPALERK
ncbi:MAG: hypothetical protein DMF91_13040 [Acidobacteria bacterium]|nr:MAG: hypothetical protein DMF91_13040 [Acidobacteriota bacterium]